MVNRLIAFTFLMLIGHACLAQTTRMKTLTELINKEDPGWPLVKERIKDGENEIEILPRDSARLSELYLKPK